MPNGLSERAVAEALDDIAGFLWEVREVWYGSVRGFTWLPAPGSRAEADFAAELFPDDVNQERIKRPAHLAVLITASGMEHMAALASLLKAREVILSAGAVARVVYEHGVRAFLSLDPDADIRVLARRAMLNDLFSASQAVYASTGFSGDAAEEWQKLAQTHLADYHELATRCFDDVSFPGSDARNWKVEGEKYPSFNQAAALWSERRLEMARHEGEPDDAGAHARGYYRVLSLFTHPQAFASHPGMRDPARLSMDIGTISAASLAAAVSMLDAISIVTAYYGRSDTQAVWQHMADRVQEIEVRYTNATELQAFSSEVQPEP
jgi:hypothetical protein